MKNEIKAGFFFVSCKKKFIFDGSQFFYLKEKRLIPILDKKDVLKAIDSKIELLTQIFGFYSSCDLEVKFSKISLEKVAQASLQKQDEIIFCLNSSGLLEAISDENSFLHAVEKEYEFYIQMDESKEFLS